MTLTRTDLSAIRKAVGEEINAQSLRMEKNLIPLKIKLIKLIASLIDSLIFWTENGQIESIFNVQ